MTDAAFAPPPRAWSIEVVQGDIGVGAVELLFDSEDCKVFIVHPSEPSGFGVSGFYAHGACHAALLGVLPRRSLATETQVALRGTCGGWHSFLHSAADGAIWTLVRWKTEEKVWGNDQEDGGG